MLKSLQQHSRKYNIIYNIIKLVDPEKEYGVFLYLYRIIRAIPVLCSMKVNEHQSAFSLHQVWPAHLSALRHPTLNPDLRGVDDESVPLALDVVVRRLFGDIKTVKFNLPGDLLLPLEDHHRNLWRWSFHMSAPTIITCEAWAEARCAPVTMLTFRQ